MKKIQIITKSIVRKILERIALKRKLENAIKKKGSQLFLHETKLGFNIWLNAKNVVDRTIYAGHFEKDLENFFRECLKKSNLIFFDIGANIGWYSLIAASSNKNTTVHAFEPADDPYNQFLKNIQENSFKNIVINKLGISDKVGEVQFNICEDNAYNSIGNLPMDKIVSKISIPVTSLDDYCKTNKINKIDIIKIDTEGAELSVLKGGEAILNSEDAPMIFAEYNRNVIKGFSSSNEDVLNYLYQRGYKIFDLKFGILRKFDPGSSNAIEIICMKENWIKKLQ